MAPERAAIEAQQPTLNGQQRRHSSDNLGLGVVAVVALFRDGTEAAVERFVVHELPRLSDLESRANGSFSSATIPSSMALIRCRRSEHMPQDSGTAGR